MGYEGARLSLCIHEMLEPTRHAGKRMTEEAVRFLTEMTRLHTPEDTGHLKSSWSEKPILMLVRPNGELEWSSGVETHVAYSEYVEHGTGLWGPKHTKYLIVPKKPGGVLHWIAGDGSDVFATRVWHPGSPGAHMVAIAVAETEAALHWLLQPVLEEWKLAAEAAFARGGRMKRPVTRL